MVNPYRIKEYIFSAVSMNDADYSAAGSLLTKYTSFPINGEVVKVRTSSNFTGSVIVGVSGGLVADVWTNTSISSGTGKINNISFTNNTGSFAVNDIIKLVISGALSGTNTLIGPVSILYR